MIHPVAKVIMSIWMLMPLAACADSPTPSPPAPSPTLISTPLPLPPTATPVPTPLRLLATVTPSGSCSIHEEFYYPTPVPNSGTAFTSRPDPLNHSAVYTGFVTYSAFFGGMTSGDALFIRNTGTDAIPFDPLHFTVPSADVTWLASKVTTVPPNSTGDFALRTRANASKIIWRIAGTLDTIEIPYTPPSGPWIIPPGECR